MRTLPSGVRASGQPGEHVARPVYGLQGVNLLRATESACRTCGAPIAKADRDDGLRGSWRHTGTPPVILADTELMALVHEAHDRNLKWVAASDEAHRLAREAYDVAWGRQKPVDHTIHVTSTSKSPGMGLKR